MSKLALFGGSKAVNRPLPGWPVYDDGEADALVRVLRSGKWWLYAYGGGPGPDDLGRLEAVHHGHAHVQQDRGEVLAQHVAQRLPAGGSSNQALAQRR